jgi:hypothetical protein
MTVHQGVGSFQGFLVTFACNHGRCADDATLITERENAISGHGDSRARRASVRSLRKFQPRSHRPGGWSLWTRPWTVKQEFTRQSEEANRLYYEPRCIEGNYGLPGLLRGARAEELAYAEGRGPHPATKDSATDFVGVEEDPLQ